MGKRTAHQSRGNADRRPLAVRVRRGRLPIPRHLDLSYSFLTREDRSGLEFLIDSELVQRLPCERMDGIRHLPKPQVVGVAFIEEMTPDKDNGCRLKACERRGTTGDCPFGSPSTAPRVRRTRRPSEPLAGM